MISVIIPIYDRKKALKESIDSILNQTYKDFELLLITDGSPKETIEIVEMYRKNPKVKIFKFIDNSGNAVRCRNKGIKESKGDYIAFQDSDDIADKNRLKVSLEYIEKFNVDVIFGSWKVINEGTRKDINLKNGEVIESTECNLEILKKICVPCQSSVMVKKNALIEVGCLKPIMQYMEDYELWLRLAYFNFKFKKIPEVLVSLRLHDGNNEINFKKNFEEWRKLVFKEYFKKSKFSPKIVYILPGTGISGGVAVILKHVNLLHKLNYDVTLITRDNNTQISWYKNYVTIIPEKSEKYNFENIDILVATGWSTVDLAKKIDSKRKIYFVQSDERRFFEDKNSKEIINKTYFENFEYMTEAKWIQKWLKKEFKHESYYVPNGIDLNFFYKTNFEERKKTRILIEGPIDIPFKGVSESYEAVKDLDCEIYFISNAGKPKKNWRYEKFFESVSMDKMKEIYSSCDILLKMSKVEGFFGPPMEAMACGCAVVVAKCTGYDEYIKDEYNALVVELNDIQGAKKCIERLINDKILRERLINNGFETVKKWSWNNTLKSLLNVIELNKTESEEILEEKMKKEIINVDKKLEINEVSHNDNCEIIIVVHNTVDYLKKCIESIKKYTKSPYILTIVDNNSNEETKNYLKTLRNVKIIYNSKNYGFGYANNKAIRESTSKYICFLNSDTIVSENWLSNLIYTLEQNNAGIVGPVSNSVSSEVQKIEYINSKNSEIEIQDFSKKRFNEFGFKTQESNRLIGFCMVTKKSILDISGIFDDRYEFNFEDDDLCLSIIEKGFKLFCTLGVFVYHFGGQTFKTRFRETTVNPILQKSRKLFEEKWYLSKRIEKIQQIKKSLSIIYLLASDTTCGGVKIVFEQANRLKDRGHNVKIYCNQNESSNWFNLHVPIIYFNEVNEIPQCDIAIGTYFSTLQVLQNVNALVKIHLCQGYEALIYNSEKEKLLIQTIEDNYTKIKEKIVISSWLKEILDPKYNIDCKLIQNGIDPYVFSLKKHGRNRIPRILIVGNYNLEIKGVKKALELLRQIPEKQIVRMASEKCKFDEAYEFHNMAKMSQDDIAKVYESCDITICASHKVEGFSLPPLESMASGTPVITTDSGGVNEYAIHNWNSIIVPQDNNTLFLHWIKQLLNNNIIYNKLVENGLKTANNFLWYSKIDALEEHLQSLYQKQIEEQKNSLSVCMIVKNEEENLEKCLKSIESITTEIIIVDTGSTDQTISIAKKFGAKIYHFDWNNNFSDARNFALSKVTQKWVLIIDADESISSKDLEKINSLLKGPQNAYSFVTRNYVKFLNIEGVIPCQGEYEEEGDNPGWCSSEKVRLFPWSDKIKFEGEVHELVEKSLDNEKIEIKDTEVQIHHWGYLKEKGKQEVYLELGKKKLETLEEPKSLYELGTQYMALNNFDEALVIWRKLLLKEPKNIIYMSRMGTTYNLLRDYKQAEKFFKEVLVIKEDEYTLKHLGICYAKQGKVQEAYECFKKIVYTTEDLKTMADFAYCCNVLKRFDESIGVLEKSLKINKLETVRWGLLEIAYNEKGLQLAKKNRFIDAIHMFKSALYINPSFDVARNNLNQIKKILDKNKRFL